MVNKEEGKLNISYMGKYEFCLIDKIVFWLY